VLSDQSSSSFRGGHWHIQTTDKACNKRTKEKSAKRSEFQFRCLYLKRIECQIKNVLKPKEHLWIVLFLSQRRTKSHLSQNKIDTGGQNYGVDRHISCFMSAVQVRKWSPDRKWFPKLYRKWFTDGKDGNIWTQEFGLWT